MRKATIDRLETAATYLQNTPNATKAEALRYANLEVHSGNYQKLETALAGVKKAKKDPSNNNTPAAAGVTNDRFIAAMGNPGEVTEFFARLYR